GLRRRCFVRPPLHRQSGSGRASAPRRPALRFRRGEELHAWSGRFHRLPGRDLIGGKTGEIHVKVLIVGGTGMIGGHAALFLKDKGSDVTLAARKPVDGASPLGGFPVLIGDYAEGTFTEADLAPFDAVVFAAGNDIRHLSRDIDEHAFWQKMQIEGVPNFVALEI